MIISFSGHRNIREKDLVNLNIDLKNFILEHKDDRFLVGGSSGFDQLVLGLLLAYKIPKENIRVVVPFKGFEKFFIKNSNQLKTLNNFNYNSGVKVIETSKTPEDFKVRIKKRNEYLVKHCDLLLVYYIDSQSGTGQTVRIAEKQQKKVKNLADSY